jgi:DNA repair exonuclease SbcCD nuclease subunit
VTTRKVVLIHSSDLHVDDGYTARLWEGDGNRPLRAVLKTADRLKAQIVLLTGDTFEHNRLPEQLLEETYSILSEAKCQIILLPGNHDPLTEDSVWYRGKLSEPKNVHVIGLGNRGLVSLPGLEMQVWGRAHLDYEDMSPLMNPAVKKARWHVVVAHGHYEAKPRLDAQLRPSWLISSAEIAASRADYLALGHWNTPKRVGGMGVKAFYSGSPDLAGTVNHVEFFQEEVRVKKARVDLAN